MSRLAARNERSKGYPQTEEDLEESWDDDDFLWDLGGGFQDPAFVATMFYDPARFPTHEAVDAVERVLRAQRLRMKGGSGIGSISRCTTLRLDRSF